MLTKALILSIVTSAARTNFETFLGNPTDANFRIVDADILAVQNTHAIEESILVEKLMTVAPAKWTAAIADMNAGPQTSAETPAPTKVKAPAGKKSAQTSAKGGKKPALAKTPEKGKARPVIEEEEEV